LKPFRFRLRTGPYSLVLTRFLDATRSTSEQVRKAGRVPNRNASPMRPNRAVQRKRLPCSHVVPPFGRSCSRLLLGGLVVQLDHDAVGVVDEDLPEIAARHLPG